MIRNFCLLIVIFILLPELLYARGRVEDTPVQTQNDEWILVITSFDTSSLIEERRSISHYIQRRLVENISAINYRTRISDEYAFYEETAWTASLQSAATALANKQNERSLLLYKGDADWVYRQNLTRLDAEIETLKARFDELENSPPLINNEPVFKLTSGNMNLQFPAAPQKGNELRFLNQERADGILFGSITEYHGRFILTVNLFTRYTRSQVWENKFIFSHDDLENILDELSRKLLLVLSGNRPSAVAIKADPEDTLVLINRSFAGRGETEILEFSPGTIVIEASAPNHRPVTFETELLPGELSKISINLKPLEFTEVEITGNHKGIQGNVYHGAVFVGEAPYTIRLPANYIELLEIKTENGDTGRVVFQTLGSNESDSFYIRTQPVPRQGSVDRARRAFYWSWAGTWISGVATWLTYHSYTGLNTAYNHGGSNNSKLREDTNNMYMYYTGSLMALGAFAVLDVILIVRYIYVSNRDSTTIK